MPRLTPQQRYGGDKGQVPDTFDEHSATLALKGRLTPTSGGKVL